MGKTSFYNGDFKFKLENFICINAHKFNVVFDFDRRISLYLKIQ